MIKLKIFIHWHIQGVVLMVRTPTLIFSIIFFFKIMWTFHVLRGWNLHFKNDWVCALNTQYIVFKNSSKHVLLLYYFKPSCYYIIHVSSWLYVLSDELLLFLAVCFYFIVIDMIFGYVIEFDLLILILQRAHVQRW